MVDHERLGMSVGEAMFTQRSIRKFRPDPIPISDLTWRWRGRQIGRFLLVTDRSFPTTLRPSA